MSNRKVNKALTRSFGEQKKAVRFCKGESRRWQFWLGDEPFSMLSRRRRDVQERAGWFVPAKPVVIKVICRKGDRLK